MYNKTYDATEEYFREQIYKSNVEYIKEFNAEGHSWTLGVNICLPLSSVSFSD